MSTIDDLRPTLDRVEAALRQFVLGDATAYQACWSQADDITLLGGWGPVSEVGSRWVLAWMGPPRAIVGEPSPVNRLRKE